ncbi:MAG: ribose-5-phosphate isomerase RpiA, partial [Candidatus Binataceae bacterium]
GIHEPVAQRQIAGRAKLAISRETGDLEALGAYALRYVRPGHTLGLGTGHAASAFIRALAKSGIRVRGVPTSNETEELARSLGIEIVSLGDVKRIDIDFDGADEVDRRLNLVKGFGGALVREKIVAAASRRCVILIGAEKIVPRLGARRSLPIEIVPFAAPYATREIARLGLRPKVRLRGDGGEFISDNGNLILDCGLREIANPARLERDLRAIPGVVGTGLFIGIADTVLVGAADGSVRVMNRRA